MNKHAIAVMAHYSHKLSLQGT